MSKPVRFIARLYGAARTGTIAALLLCLVGRAAAAGAVVCVLVPHFKDEYWLSVGYGLESEAARHDMELLFFEAGGYRALDEQIAQLRQCAQRDTDAVLLGAVTSGHPDLLAEIATTAPGRPVYGLVNEMQSPVLAGRVGVDWRGMGAAIGDSLNTRHPAGTPAKTAVLITGPKSAGWTGPLAAGLEPGLASSAVTLLASFRADTGLRPQLEAVERALEQYPNVDYLIGSAPAVEAAMGLRASRPDAPAPILLSTYISHSVLRGLTSGSVAAASFDDPVQQGVMAIQLVARQREATQMIGPAITLLETGSELLDAVTLSPAEYFPALR